MLPTPGHNFTQHLGKLTFDMIWVEGGEFWMGVSREDGTIFNLEEPRHKEVVSSFWMGKFPVTQALWKWVTGTNPSFVSGLNCPVEWVPFHDCAGFLSQLEEDCGLPFRLPTEAEWEYTARGGNYQENYQYSGSDKLSEVGWYHENSHWRAHPVGLKLPNELGIYDMTGNTWEWCTDYLDYDPPETLSDGTLQTKAAELKKRALRGGSWSYFENSSRMTERLSREPGFSSDGIGLRLALSLPQ